MIVTLYLWIDSDISIIKLNFQCTQPSYFTSLKMAMCLTKTYSGHKLISIYLRSFHFYYYYMKYFCHFCLYNYQKQN